MWNCVRRELNVDKAHYLVIMTPFCQVLGPLRETLGGINPSAFTSSVQPLGSLCKSEPALERAGWRQQLLCPLLRRRDGMGWDGMGCCTHLLSQLPANEENPGDLQGKDAYSVSETRFSLRPLCLVIAAVRGCLALARWVREGISMQIPPVPL